MYKLVIYPSFVLLKIAFDFLTSFCKAIVTKEKFFSKSLNVKKPVFFSKTWENT